jgi:hypothetical protein
VKSCPQKSGLSTIFKVQFSGESCTYKYLYSVRVLVGKDVELGIKLGENATFLYLFVL